MNRKSVFTDYILNYKSLLLLFLALVLNFIFRTLYLYDTAYQQAIAWNLADWLINYQDGGFKRRGLSGSLFFLLQDISHVRLQLLVYFFQVAVYLFWFYNLYRLLKDKIISPYFLTLFITPLTFAFCFAGWQEMGRKEILIFALYTYFIFLVSNNKLSRNKEVLILFLISIITLCHEMILFYVAFFPVALYWYNQKFEPKRYALYFLNALVPVIFIFLFGGEINMGESYTLLHERGVDFSVSGILDWQQSEMNTVYSNFELYKMYPVAFLVVFILFGFVLWYSYLQKQFEPLLLMFFVCLIFSLPIYFLAKDWSRWLNLQFLLFLIMLCGMLQKGVYSASKILWNKTVIVVFAIIVYMNLWDLTLYGNGFRMNGGAVFLLFQNIKTLFPLH